jgi:hypothetical protein
MPGLRETNQSDLWNFPLPVVWGEAPLGFGVYRCCVRITWNYAFPRSELDCILDVASG